MSSVYAFQMITKESMDQRIGHELPVSLFGSPYSSHLFHSENDVTLKYESDFLKDDDDTRFSNLRTRAETPSDSYLRAKESQLGDYCDSAKIHQKKRSRYDRSRLVYSAIRYNTGKWEMDEHDRYLEYMKMNDIDNDNSVRRKKRFFTKMSEHVKTRSAAQCRSHHQKSSQASSFHQSSYCIRHLFFDPLIPPTLCRKRCINELYNNTLKHPNQDMDEETEHLPSDLGYEEIKPSKKKNKNPSLFSMFSEESASTNVTEPKKFSTVSETQSDTEFFKQILQTQFERFLENMALCGGIAYSNSRRNTEGGCCCGIDHHKQYCLRIFAQQIHEYLTVMENRAKHFIKSYNF